MLAIVTAVIRNAPLSEEKVTRARRLAVGPAINIIREFEEFETAKRQADYRLGGSWPYSASGQPD